MPDITVVAAASAETGDPTPWEDAIIEITKALVRNRLADEPGFGLGGHWSYATRFSNDTFYLSSYCWCERDDCPHCSGCDCPDDAFWHTIDGKPCTWEESHQFFDDNIPNINTTPYDEWDRIADEVNARRGSGQHEHLLCDYCKGTKWAEYGQVPGWGVPLFWHKLSGFRMSWYKYLGRDTRVYIPEGCTITPDELLASCLESIGCDLSEVDKPEPTCTCNDDDGTYTVDGKEVSHWDFFDFCMEHNDWKTRTTSFFPKDKRCDWCRSCQLASTGDEE
jgi:hypothetical protein